MLIVFLFFPAGCDFIQKHIFPGGICPSISALCEAMRKHSQLQLEALDNFGGDYAETLRRSLSPPLRIPQCLHSLSGFFSLALYLSRAFSLSLSLSLYVCLHGSLSFSLSLSDKQLTYAAAQMACQFPRILRSPQGSGLSSRVPAQVAILLLLL